MTPFAQPRAQFLPFGQIPWQHFEKICLRLIWRDQSVEHSQSYGVQGNAQEGIDIYARHLATNLYSTYQCKNVEEFSAAKIREAVDVFLKGQWAEQSSTFVLCTRNPLTSKSQSDEIEQQAKRLRRKKITFLVWDGERLSMLLKEHPDIVDDFFERHWVTAFCGADAAQQLGQRLSHVQSEKALVAYHAWLRNKMGRVTYRGFSPKNHNSSVLELPIELVYVAPNVKAEAGDQKHNRREREILNRLEECEEQIGQAQLEDDLREIQAEDWRSLSPSNVEVLQSWGLISLAESSASIPIGKVLSVHNQSVILGSPGAGKSLLLQWLALECVRGQIKVDLPPASAVLTDGTSRFPILISLAGFANSLRERNGLSLTEFIAQHLESLDIENLAALYRREWKENRCWVLLDGLDEVADPDMRAITVQKVESFLAICSQNRCTVTSRVHGYERIKGVDHFYLQGFNREQGGEFISRWHLAVEIETRPGEGDEDEIKERSRSLIEQINANDHLQTLAANPLLLVAMLLLHKEFERLPHSRVEIYEAMTHTLLETWNRWRSQEKYDAGGQKLSATQLRRVLERVALWTRQEKPHGLLRRAELKRQIIAALESEGWGQQAELTAQSYLSAAVEQAGLLEERSPGIFAFWHPIFTEFLSAGALAATPGSLATKIEELRGNPYWREVILLAIGLVGVVHEDKKTAQECICGLIRSAGSIEPVLHGALRLGAACVAENPRLSRSLSHEILLELTRVLTRQPFEPMAGSFIETAEALATLKPDPELIAALKGLVAIPNSLGPSQSAAYRILANATSTDSQALQICQQKIEAQIHRDSPEKEVMARFYATIGLVRAGQITGQNLSNLVWHHRPIGFITEVVELLGLDKNSSETPPKERELRLKAISEVLDNSFPPGRCNWPASETGSEHQNAIMPSLAAALILLFAGQNSPAIDAVIEEALKPKYDGCGGVFDAAQVTQMISSDDQERDMKHQRLALVAFRRWLHHPQPYRKIHAAECVLGWIERWEELYGGFIETHPDFEGQTEETKNEKFFEAYGVERSTLRQEAFSCIKKCLSAPPFQLRSLAARMLLQRGEVRSVIRALVRWTKTAPQSFPGLSILPLVSDLCEFKEGQKAVVSWLQGENDWLKCAAASVVSAQFPEQSRQALWECLESPHDEIRSGVGGMLALRYFVNKEPLPLEIEKALRSCLESDLGDASQNAANALFRFNFREEEVLIGLMPYLYSSQVGARFETIRAIEEQNQEEESLIEGFITEMGLQPAEFAGACEAVSKGQVLSERDVQQLLILTSRQEGENPMVTISRRFCMDWVWWNKEIKSRPRPYIVERYEQFFPNSGLDKEDLTSDWMP